MTKKQRARQIKIRVSLFVGTVLVAIVVTPKIVTGLQTNESAYVLYMHDNGTPNNIKDDVVISVDKANVFNNSSKETGGYYRDNGNPYAKIHYEFVTERREKAIKIDDNTYKTEDGNLWEVK